MNKLPQLNQCKVVILGLGYVGLPLLKAFGSCNSCIRTQKKINRKVIGFDIDDSRIKELLSGIDRTKEVSSQDLKNLKNTTFTSDINDLLEGDVFIVTVPTPIDKFNKPDLQILENASKTIGFILKKRLEKRKSDFSKPVIIYESTVYPGATEEVCIPLIEKESKLKLNLDFFCGYSPERINPGDANRKLSNIVKVTSGSDNASGEWVDAFYGSIIEAGTFKTDNIKVAEAAKVIENTQRDLNIALINELSMIFEKLGIDTLDVLNAASTKWNFLPFKPGLVGGHCIGVDPFYLTHKATEIGYYPEVVLAGRRINDSMAKFVGHRIIKEIAKRNINIPSSKILILGTTFKENCPDFRNTKVVDIINFLIDFNLKIDIFDPIVSKVSFENEHNLKLKNKINKEDKYDVVLIAVPHSCFNEFKDSFWTEIINKKGFIFDLKGMLPKKYKAIRL
tara:strand:+ start:29246 stop:30598 length:1353 start_codon:yes stop_codon:yes gene_type:complete